MDDLTLLSEMTEMTPQVKRFHNEVTGRPIADRPDFTQPALLSPLLSSLLYSGTVTSRSLFANKRTKVPFGSFAMSEVRSSGTYLVPLGNSGDPNLAAEIAKLSSALPSFERGIILKYSIPAALISEFSDEWQRPSISPASLLLLKEKLARKISICEYQECGSLFSSIFRDFSSERSKEIAKGNVRRLSIDNSGDISEKMSSKVYGEIEFHSFCNLLERVGIQKGEVLYDLGHGTGKAMVKSAFTTKLILFFCYCTDGFVPSDMRAHNSVDCNLSISDCCLLAIW